MGNSFKNISITDDMQVTFSVVLTLLRVGISFLGEKFNAGLVQTFSISGEALRSTDSELGLDSQLESLSDSSLSLSSKKSLL